MCALMRLGDEGGDDNNNDLPNINVENADNLPNAEPQPEISDATQETGGDDVEKPDKQPSWYGLIIKKNQ